MNSLIAGVDEAGRGPLAGPVVAAAAVLTTEQKEALLAMGLTDSKKLTPRKREKIMAAMLEMGVIWKAQAASNRRIDRMNILQASLWAMGKAVTHLPCQFSRIVVDGTFEIPGISFVQEALPRADSLIPEVAAASVFAKVLRDRVMVVLDNVYPGYGFAKHKGYPTKAHREALALLGPTPVHRESFSWGRS
jgi:ribonuclease HII